MFSPTTPRRRRRLPQILVGELQTQSKLLPDDVPVREEAVLALVDGVALGGWRTRPGSLRRLQSQFLLRGADDAATVAPDAGDSVGGKALREYSYATGTPIAATPQFDGGGSEGGMFL